MVVCAYFIYLFIYLLIYLLIYLFIYLFIFLFIYLIIYLHIYLASGATFAGGPIALRLVRSSPNRAVRSVRIRALAGTAQCVVV